jgi:hypothetical protein
MSVPSCTVSRRIWIPVPVHNYFEHAHRADMLYTCLIGGFGEFLWGNFRVMTFTKNLGTRGIITLKNLRRSLDPAWNGEYLLDLGES